MSSLKKIWQGNRLMLLFFAFLAMAVTCFELTGFITAHANETGAMDFSLATISEAATIYANNMSALDKEGLNEMSAVTTGNVGGIIGFEDSDSTDKNYWLCAKTSANAVTWSYNSKLRSGSEGAGAFAGLNTLADKASNYMYYGYALSTAGFDEVTTVATATTGLRKVFGIAFMILYVGAISMPLFFNLVLTVLRAANPFRMFATADHMGNRITAYGGDSNTVAGTITSALHDFSSAVGDLYDALYDMSFAVIIPIFIAVAVFMWLVIYKGQNFGRVFKNLALRITFVVLGVPILFALYDAALTACMGMMNPGNFPATSIVGGTFCDFAAWVNNSNLNPPDGAVLHFRVTTSGQFELMHDTIANTRNTCYLINKQSYPSVFDDSISHSGFNVLNADYQYNHNAMEASESVYYDVGANSDSSDYSSLLDGNSEDSISVVLNMLQSYVRGNTISSAMYEANVVKKILSNISDPTVPVALMGLSDNWLDYDDKSASTFVYNSNDGGGTGANVGSNNANSNVNDINMTAEQVSEFAKNRWGGTTEIGGVGSLSTTQNIFANGTLNCDTILGYKSYTGTEGGSYGLSTLAMYNYLNSEFTEHGVKVTSPESTASDQTIVQHYAVTSVGTGLLKFVYLVNAAVLLGCVTVLGYGYAFGLFVANIKVLIQMLPKVLTGMLGSMRGIAGAIVFTFALICEVIGTIFLFDVASTLIYTVYDLIEMPLNLIMQSAFPSGGSSAAIMVSALTGIITAGAIAMLVQKLLLWRTAVIGAATAACTELVNKLCGTAISTPNLDSKPGSAAAVLGTVGEMAVGMSAAAAMGGNIGSANGTGSSALSGLRDSAVQTFSGIGAAGLGSTLSNPLGVKTTGGTQGSYGQYDANAGLQSKDSGVDGTAKDAEKNKDLQSSGLNSENQDYRGGEQDSALESKTGDQDFDAQAYNETESDAEQQRDYDDDKTLLGSNKTGTGNNYNQDKNKRDTPKSQDALESQYIDDNAESFESSIGYDDDKAQAGSANGSQKLASDKTGTGNNYNSSSSSPAGAVDEDVDDTDVQDVIARRNSIIAGGGTSETGSVGRVGDSRLNAATHMPDGTVTSKSGSTTTTTTKTTDEDGNVVVEMTETDSSANTTKTSRLVQGSFGTEVSSSITNADGSGEYATESVDSKTGEKHMTRTVTDSSGGQTVIDEVHTRDGSGNAVVQVTQSGSGQPVIQETRTTDSSSGNVSIDRTVTTNEGMTEIHQTVVHSGGETVVTTSEVNANGNTTEATAVHDSSTGRVLHSDSTTYSESGEVIDQTHINTISTNQNIQTVTEHISGGTTEVTTETENQSTHVINVRSEVKQEGISGSIVTTEQRVPSANGGYVVKNQKVQDTTYMNVNTNTVTTGNAGSGIIASAVKDAKRSTPAGSASAPKGRKFAK